MIGRPRRIHIILPSSPWLADATTNIPLGPLYLAAVLRNQGHDVVMTSRLDHQDHGPATLPPETLDSDLHLLSFCTPQFHEALELAAYIKDHHPAAVIIAGGAHPTAEPAEVLTATRQPEYHTPEPLRARRRYTQAGESPLFDAVVIGEGEGAILQILDDLVRNRFQAVYHGLPQPVDQIPCPAWDLLPASHWHNHGAAVMKHPYFPNPQYPDASAGVLSILGARGCPYRCTFCATPGMGTRPRFRSPASIVEELSAAMVQGMRQFKFQDDTYTLAPKRLTALADRIEADLGPGSFAARVHTRVNTMSPAVAGDLARMNTRVCCFGVESGAQAVLDANRKGTTVRQNTEAIRIAKAHGFTTIAFLVLGMAGETLATMRETQAWLQQMRGDLDACTVAMGIPYPGSAWWADPAAAGIEILDYNYDHHWLVGFSARDEVIVRPHSCTLDTLHQIKSEMYAFLLAEGWRKPEWDADAQRAQTLSLPGVS